MATSGLSDVDRAASDLENLPVAKKSVPDILGDLGTIVFLGEGNFTFCSAFAVYRQSWSNIVPTEIVLDDKSWDDILNHCQRIAQNQYHEILDSLKNNRPTRQKLDATNMGTREDLLQHLELGKVEKLTFWFQCPWYKDRGNASDIVSSFGESAARIQQAGEYLVIGVCTIPQYFEKYGLSETETWGGYYKHVGTDVTFVQQMRARGYEWTSSRAGSAKKLNYETDFKVFIFQRSSAPFKG